MNFREKVALVFLIGIAPLLYPCFQEGDPVKIAIVLFCWVIGSALFATGERDAT